MNATEQYFPVVLYMWPCTRWLTFESVGEMLKRDHSNESFRAVVPCGAFYYAVQGRSNF